jgi:hypothetical protein
LARELLADLEGLYETEIEKLWVDAAIRCDEDLDKGTGRAFPAEEVLERARARRK